MMDNDFDIPSEHPKFGVIDVARILLANLRAIAIFTLGPVAIAILVGGMYYASQPKRWTSVVEIRPAFEGAEKNEYPNGVKFDASDIVAVPVLDQVFDRNKIGDFCSREAFRSGFFVEQTSAARRFLDMEY